MTIWFTADHHFGHANIIRHCGRPFTDVKEMDEFLIERWNDVVGAHDEVWHLGDFAYRCGPRRMAEIFGCLRGKALHLVRGNHDRKHVLALPWTSVQPYAEIRLQERMIVLFHYPLREWNNSRRGSWSLHGHTHGKLPRAGASCDVGVDAWDLRPAACEEIATRIAGGNEVP
ncbi:metallophosphoesterase [Methylorubrum populi]|uniref:Metallophosphoesterase n=1 Tax=Methylorubrum rhodesianum TaxID=29427 RepID=A0ABU9Z4V5_9HYPH|nr:metallophosphoesterase family protein [Methylorubrum rhodesianum]MBK3402633.1 metallophosphoesterase [Methylorubrum rhodesianum]MBY0138818.1 metallophosphoesterase [Methylorubrum populi]